MVSLTCSGTVNVSGTEPAADVTDVVTVRDSPDDRVSDGVDAAPDHPVGTAGWTEKVAGEQSAESRFVSVREYVTVLPAAAL